MTIQSNDQEINHHYGQGILRRPSCSGRLRSPEAIHALILGSCFKEVNWIDTTSRSLDWFHLRPSNGTPALGLHLLLGSNFGNMFSNVVRNLEEQRITLIQATFECAK